MSNKDAMLAALSDQMANLLLVFMRLAREDLSDHSLDELRPVLLETLPDKLRPIIDDVQAKIEAGLDQAGDGVLEVAATLLSRFDLLSGKRAADIVRQLKGNPAAFKQETAADLERLLTSRAC